MLLFTLAVCAAAYAKDAADVRAQVEKTMSAFLAMDAKAFESELDERVTSYEMDLNNAPVHIGSRKEAVSYAEMMFAGLKGAGAKLRMTVDAMDCDAQGAMAYCTVAFRVDGTMGDGSSFTEPWRNTVVLRKEAGGWKWVHWHSSLNRPSEAAK